LGSGNHYLEVQKVETIFDKEQGERLGIRDVDQVVIMIHCGSRGFGHQVATDYLQRFERKQGNYKISLSDKQLACAPFTSSDGQSYYSAMNAAANYAFANRQAITYQTREVFSDVFGRTAEELGMNLVYDVAHNIAKVEEYNGKSLVVHRKGATRSFPNLPVIIGGSMESGSYLLVGTKEALRDTFGSTAHGSGRTMSRHQAKKMVHGFDVSKRLEKAGILVKSASFAGLAEEVGIAYKNISDVVKSVTQSGISESIAYFKPLGNIKG